MLSLLHYYCGRRREILLIGGGLELCFIIRKVTKMDGVANWFSL